MLPKVTGHPQQNELRAMPLLERLAHAHRAAMVEDKEAIELAAEHIAALEEVLRELIKSPDGVRRLDHLRRGIGTATPDRVWLDAERLVDNEATAARTDQNCITQSMIDAD